MELEYLTHGNSTRDLTKKFGVCQKTIINWLNKHHIKKEKSQYMAELQPKIKHTYFKKGHKVPNEWRDIYRKNNKGVARHITPHSEETKIKISNSRKGISAWNKGKIGEYKQTDSHRENTRLAKIRYVERIRLDGMPLYPTIGLFEKPILDKLEEYLMFEIKRQYKVAGYFLDGYCSALNLAIEIDEPFHKEQLYKDTYREEQIKKELKCSFLRIEV